MNLKFILALILLVLLNVTACRKKNANTQPVQPTDTAGQVLTPYTIKIPAHFPRLIIPDDNKPFAERIQLGRMLYYDPILSSDGSRACASCHYQKYGFTKQPLEGNMPVLPHVNMGWYSNYMWDGSQKGTLEDVMLFEVKDFFHTNLATINASEKYRTLFKKSYGTENITYKELSYALAQFARTMVSGDTKYDRFLKGYEKLTPDEYKGYMIFFTEKGDCFHCHSNVTTTDNLFHNTGLDSIYTKDQDKGYYNVSGNTNDLGKFRTPNLRNVALRSYFMHDGRFNSLEEVIDFYDHGVHKVFNVDPIMTKAGKENGLQLTADEKRQLVAFLKTFTDSVFITNPELSNPE